MLKRAHKNPDSYGEVFTAMHFRGYYPYQRTAQYRTMMVFLVVLYFASFIVITLVHSRYELLEYLIAIVFLVGLTQFFDYLFFKNLSD